MRNSVQKHHDRTVKCCAICGGKFGLIRHYYWRTALCSRKCVDRFSARREADQKWLRFARGLIHATQTQAEFEGKSLEGESVKYHA